MEVLKDLLVQAAVAFQELRHQANAQMLSLAAQLAEFKRKVFGPCREALSMLQPELWSGRVELPASPKPSSRSMGTSGAARAVQPSMRTCRADVSSTT